MQDIKFCWYLLLPQFLTALPLHYYNDDFDNWVSNTWACDSAPFVLLEKLQTFFFYEKFVGMLSFFRRSFWCFWRPVYSQSTDSNYRPYTFHRIHLDKIIQSKIIRVKPTFALSNFFFQRVYMKNIFSTIYGRCKESHGMTTALKILRYITLINTMYTHTSRKDITSPDPRKLGLFRRKHTRLDNNMERQNLIFAGKLENAISKMGRQNFDDIGLAEVW